MTDLAREFSDAAFNVTGDELAVLFAAGVSEDALQPMPHLGLAAIQTHGSTYEPTDTDQAVAVDQADKAVIVPCGRWDFVTWDLVDLVAFHLAQPERWYRRLGVADVLGDTHGFTVDPKTLHPTPPGLAESWGQGTGRTRLVPRSRGSIDGRWTPPSRQSREEQAAGSRRGARQA